MKIFIEKDYDSVSRRAAQILAAQVTLKSNSLLGLATGTTPLGLYDILAEENKAGLLDFSEVRTVNLDEYLGLAGDHPQSYRYFMNENLFDKINIAKENTFLLNGMAEDKEKECSAFEAMIDSLGGLDLQLLGLGNNSHIGFNEPGEAFVKETHLIELTQSTIDANSRLFADKSEVPRYALTMGIGSIMKARSILLVVSGQGKAEALRNTLQGPINPQVPGSILQLHANLYVVADEDAAKYL